MNTCSECTFWAPEAPIVKEKENMGECNKLSHPKIEIDKDLLLPVLEGQDMMDMKQTEILTTADFGCNQFSQN